MVTYVLANGVVAANSVFGSLQIDGKSMYVQVSGSAGVTGTLTIQTSADNVSYVNNATTIALAVLVNSGQYSVPCRYVKFSFNNTGAAGTLTLVVNVL